MKLSLQCISKTFSAVQKPVSVLKNITYQFEQGRSFAIVGSSGCGKSTLLHIMAGFEPATQGRVLWDGRDLNDYSSLERETFVANNLGFVFQYHYLLKELTVYENILLGSLIRKELEHVRTCRARRVLEQVGVWHKRDMYPHTLSGGEQQRVAIARALTGKPRFLIADEPTGNLDEHTGAEIIALCLELQEEHSMGMVIATHDTAVYRQMDEVLELHDGCIQSRKAL